MRIKGEIHEVRKDGDQLVVRMSGTAQGADSEWRPLNVVTFECPDLGANRRALRVGRKIVVEIKAV